MTARSRLNNFYRQASFDRFVKVGDELLHRFSLCGTAGIAGTSAQKPSSSASCTTTLIFIPNRRSVT